MPATEATGEARGEKPAIKAIDNNSLYGTIGLGPDAYQIVKMVEFEGKPFFIWVSDCAVHIHTETRAKDATEFTFLGCGAVDKRSVKFTMPAGDLAYPQRFKAALLNAFGAQNKIGGLDFELVQDMSLFPRVVQRVEVPMWDGSVPLVPGVGLAENVEYRLYKKTPAEVYEGDIGASKEGLRNLLGLNKYAPILVTAILGSPAYARWYPNDRFGIGLWGGTGSRKTSTLLAALSMYGVDYASKERLLKSDEQASTPTACGDIAAAAGIMPQSYDNVKTVDDKQLKKYVSFVHNVLEGGEKDRAKKDGGVRDTRAYLCTLIITGEVRPQEASTTARVLNLTWSDVNLENLSFVQEHVDLMPIIGYHWLRFLSTATELDGFKEARSKKDAEFSKKRYTNPGRLATNYSLLLATWDLLCESPFGDVFQEYTERFKEALDQAIEEQARAVNEETEVEKFLSGLRGLIASNPHIVLGNNDSESAFNRQIEIPKPPLNGVIGKWCDDGLFLLPEKTLAELERMRIFTQRPSVDSLTKALHTAGKLIPSLDGEHLKVQRRMNNSKPWGWLLNVETCLLQSPSNNT